MKKNYKFFFHKEISKTIIGADRSKDRLTGRAIAWPVGSPTAQKFQPVGYKICAKLKIELKEKNSKNAWPDLDHLTGLDRFTVPWPRVTHGIKICVKSHVSYMAIGQGPVLISLRSSKNYNVKFCLTGRAIALQVEQIFFSFLVEKKFLWIFFKFYIQFCKNF